MAGAPAGQGAGEAGSTVRQALREAPAHGGRSGTASIFRIIRR